MKAEQNIITAIDDMKNTNCGTCVMRSLAITDSIQPIITAVKKSTD
jgi:hypothetical protein